MSTEQEKTPKRIRKTPSKYEDYEIKKTSPKNEEIPSQNIVEAIKKENNIEGIKKQNKMTDKKVY